MPTITSAHRKALIQAILTFCHAEGHDIRQILAHPPIVALAEKYNPRQLQDIVGKLTRAGLLFKRGQTRAAVYLTTATGLKALAEVSPDG